MRSLIRRLAGILTMASLLALSGCGSNKAPAIEAQNLLDASQTLNLAQPKKPTLVVFWATNCSSCIEEIPSIIALQKMYGDKIHIVGVAMSFDDPTTLKNFVVQRQHISNLVGQKITSVQQQVQFSGAMSYVSFASLISFSIIKNPVPN